MNRLRSVALLVAALILAACRRPAPTDRAACPHDPAARSLPLAVTLTPPPTRLREDVSRAAMARLEGVETLATASLEGLTVASHRLGFKTLIGSAPAATGGGTCAWIDALTVDMSPADISIYVPSDYPTDSCEHEQILLHERQHEEIHRRLLGESAEFMRRAYLAADWLPTKATPMHVRDRAEAERRITELVQRIAKPVYARFRADLDREQAVLDQPESYRWVTSRCTQWKTNGKSPER